MTHLLEDPQALRAPPRDLAAILGIGTAAPPAVSQEEAAALAEQFSCTSDGQRAWLRRVFSRAGVERRGTVLMNGQGMADVQGFYRPAAGTDDRGPSTATRMERYAREAPPLAEAASRRAMHAAGLSDPRAITHLITVSCTGFFAPGLDVALIRRLGLRPDVRRLHLGFMGCHAAFNALGAARDALGADPHARVLVCCVELCTLHFAYGWQPEKLVANALFADGAAACVVGPPDAQASAGPAWRICQTASLLLPESQEAMTWRIGDHGFEMTLSAQLPALIATHMRTWCEQWLTRAGLSPADVAHWAIHPGGPKILAAAMQAMGLSEPDVATSREILSRHGNLSSATLLFLLEALATRPTDPAPRRNWCAAVGFGPGLMAEGLLLERCP